jgi:hypothetical protein
VRLNVRLGDAHYPYSIPMPRVRTRIVLHDDLHEEVTERIIREDRENLPDREWKRYKSPERPAPTTRVRPYDWAKRREGVMSRFKNVSNWVQPIGYVAPYEPPVLPGKDAGEVDREKELTYLIATQDLDLAPMWAELAANGLTAFSKDNAVETEDGESEAGDVPEDTTGDMVALAIQLEHGRREQFARERDYANWHTANPRRAQFVTNAEGKRGIVPKPGSVFTRPELQEMLSRKPAENVEEGEVGKWLDSLVQPDFETLDQIERYEADRVKGFTSGEPCPARLEMRADGSPLCQAGIVPITDEDGEVIDYDDCPTCGGNGSVLSILGMDLPVVDSE